MSQYIVRSDTGLPAVEELPEDYPSGTDPYVCRTVHYYGAFAAQLQGYRGEVLSSLGHYQASHGLASREEDIVEFLLQKSRVHIPSAFDNSRVSRIEYF